MTGFIHRCGGERARAAEVAPPDFAREYFVQDAADRCARLSARQSEVLRLVCKGMRLREISALLGITVHTVREHRERMLVALEVGSGAEAAVLATKAGLV